MFYIVNCDLEEDVIRPKNQIKIVIIIIFLKANKTLLLIPKTMIMGGNGIVGTSVIRKENLAENLMVENQTETDGQICKTLACLL